MLGPLVTASDIEREALADPASLYAPATVVAVRTMRKRAPLEYAALIVRLRRVHGYASLVDRWDREILRSMRPAGADSVDLDLDSQDQPRPTLRNAIAAIRAELGREGGHLERCALDTFAGVVTVDGERVTDVRESRLAVWLDEAHGIRVPSALAGEALRVVAADNAYHPVRDYLSALTWDGTTRAESWLSRLLGVEDSPLHAAYAQAWLVGAVARVMEPGCKLDTVLLLVGIQGARKSSALRALAGEWFADTGIDVRDKDARQALNGVWIYEWGELDAVRRSEASAVKAFITAQVDHYRPSYGRNTVDVPRQTVIVGSTNEPDPLTDPSGSRRYWPVRVGAIDVEGIRAERDQLWAEAVALYRSGAHWWLSSEYDAERADAAETYSAVDPWAAPVVSWLRMHGPATLANVIRGALDRSPADQTRGDSMRVAALLAAAGATKERSTVGRREVFWRMP